MLIGRGIFGMAGLAALALSSAPAHSQTTAPQYAYYPDPNIPVGFQYQQPYAGDHVTLKVDVKASIGGVCGFKPGAEPNASFTENNIDTVGWSETVSFTANCTAPWRIAITSQNGALRNSAAVATGYQNLAPYDVTLNVAYDTGLPGGSGIKTATCPVAQIKQGSTSTACVFKGPAASGQGLDVLRSVNLSGSNIKVAAPAYPGPDVLVSGTYTDTLTVTVYPSI